MNFETDEENILFLNFLGMLADTGDDGDDGKDTQDFSDPGNPGGGCEAFGLGILGLAVMAFAGKRK